MRRIVIFGATSAIAQSFARHAAARGDALFLVGRNAEKLSVVADDLRVRGASGVHCAVVDLDDTRAHAPLVDEAERALGGLDGSLIAHGTLTDQAAAESDFAVAQRDIHTNFLSAASLLTSLASRFEQRRSGTIVAISSVAGDRGRRSNYVYGSAKAGLSAFLSGLRSRLAKSGVSVVTIKPGFVDTPMTAHLAKNALFASPDYVGRRIYTAFVRGEDIVYVPFVWRFVMLVVRCIPEGLFKRLG